MQFARHAIELVENGHKVALFLKVQFLEGQERKGFFKQNPPKYIYVSSSRLKCAKNGEFKRVKSSAVAYAWFVWEKGFDGESTIRWVN